MTFQDPGARTPVDIQVRLRGGNAPPLFDPDSLPDYEPPKAAAPQAAPATTPQAAPFDPASLPDYQPPPPAPPEKQISTAQAFGSNLANQLESGTGPIFEGMASAAGPDWNQSQAGHDIAPLIGGIKMLGNYLSDHPDPEVQKSFREGRDAAQKDLDLAQKQHKIASGLGSLVGAIAMPVPGLGEASLGARVLRGAAAGGVLGGAQSAGESFSRGETAPEAAEHALTGGLIGGATGGVLHGALGPRVPVPATTPGGRAAETFAAQGTPIGRGFTSDSKLIQGTTAKFRMAPFIGARLNKQLAKAAEKSGERLSDLSESLTGGATGRAAHDVIMRSALQDVIKSNNTRANAAYNGVRRMIDPNRAYQLPRTRAAVDKVIAERTAAGWKNPEQGLEQVSNIADRGGFNGTHRARFETRNEENKLVPNPGYDAKDFNDITKAMTDDLRSIVHTEGGQKALDAFDKAETEFGPIAEQNKELHRILNARGEASIATLLKATKEIGGDIPLLAGLKAKMSPTDFQHIGGAVLGELGRRAPDEPFSFARFVTGYSKLSNQAKGILFSPSHRKDLDDLFGAGQHLGKALEESNTSHTSGPLLAWEALKDLAELGTAVVAGHATMGTAATAVGMGAGGLLGTWLASPAKTAAIRAFTKSYGAWRVSPTPARAAVFKVATRNLAHNLGVPVEQITSRFTQAQPQSESPQQTPAGPVNQ